MKRLTLVFLALLTAVGPAFALAPSQVSALSGAQFQAGRIMDDSIFFNPTTMDIGAIQGYLNAKVPVCDTNGTQPRGGTTRAAYGASQGYPAPYTCLKDFRQDTPAKGAENALCNAITPGNRSAAEIIYDVSRACGVNPQVLLVLLQKEQSLVTDDWPWSIQYRSATGYGCPDTAPCDAEYYGFFNQVYMAARQFKRYIRDASTYNFRAGFTNYIQYNPNGDCGGTNVFIETRATAALYNYTPYQPNPSALANLYGEGDGCGAYGNRNFWRMFNDWFGPTFGTVLLKGSGPTIYVRGGNPDKAYGVPSGEVLRAYGLEGVAVTGVSDNYLATLNTSNMLTTLFRKPQDNTVFLADGSASYGIASGAVCTMWNLPCGNASLIADLPYIVTNAMASGPALGNLMWADNTLFVMDNGTRKPFLSADDKSSSPYASETPTTIKSVLNSSQPGGNPEIYSAKFMRVNATGAIYYFNGGQYFSFTSFENFKNWYNGATVFNDRYSAFNVTAPTATALPDLATDGTTHFAPFGASKISLPSAPSGTPISTVTYPNLTSLLQSKSITPTDDTKAIRFGGGAIMVLTGGELRPMPTLTDLSLFSPTSSVTAVPDSLLSAYPVGKLYITSGRVVKLAGSSAIYLYGADGNLWGFDTAGEVNASMHWVRNALEVAPSHVSYSSTKQNISVVSFNGNYYAVQPDGKARLLPAAILNGQAGTNATPLTGGILGRIPVDTRSASFIHFSNGMIAAVQGSTIRPISSFSTYSSMGGNPSNTVEASNRALAIFNVGSSL